MIFQNICAGVRLNERPTLTSTERVAARPSSVFRITGGSAATNPIITIVTALRPKMTRNNGYISTIGADANAASHVSHAARRIWSRLSKRPSATPTIVISAPATSVSAVVSRKRWTTFSSTTIRSNASRTCDGSGTM